MSNLIMQALRSIQSGTPFSGAQEQGALRKFVGINHAARKAAVQTVTSSTVFVNDDTLFVELPVGEHLFDIYAPMTCAAAGNIKMQFVAAGGLAVSAIKATATLGLDATAPTLLDITALSSSVNGGTSTAWTQLNIRGSVFVTAQGILQFQWAQQASSVTATTIRAGSTIQTRQVL